MQPLPEGTDELIEQALIEDLRGEGDLTTRAVIPATATCRAEILARSDSIVAGLGVVERVFRMVGSELRMATTSEDGAAAHPGQVLLSVSGRAGEILTAERTALNFLQHLSGIATLTARFVEAVRPYPARILDTRKTIPGLRALEKYAVRCGGGQNHRSGLYDAIMIKDNHLACLDALGGWRFAELVAEARRQAPGKTIEVEVDTEAQFQEALEAEPDWILLDNMTRDQLRHCVQAASGRCRLEASGGVTLESVAAIASTGVDAISIGALTQSAPAVDYSLEVLS